MTNHDAPTLDEVTAVLAAVDTYGKKMRPRQRRMVSDGPRLLAELREAIARVEAVWSTKPDGEAS